MSVRRAAPRLGVVVDLDVAAALEAALVLVAGADVGATKGPTQDELRLLAGRPHLPTLVGKDQLTPGLAHRLRPPPPPAR